MKKLTFILTSLLLIGCNSSNINSSSNSSSINNNEVETIIKSPNEDGGLEGNAEEDLVKPQDVSILKNFLLKVALETHYTYEITATIGSTSSHFINHITPYAWYEENDDPKLSFGYAEELNTGAVFKYYLGDNNEVIPSIYEYTYYNGEISKLIQLYTPLSITHINLLLSNMDDFAATSIGVNKFLITDLNIGSIFQYMTTFGSSIMNYINSIYIEIVNYDENIFISTCDLGEYGKIEGKFTPTDNSKIQFVNDLVMNGEITGIEYHNDVYELLNNKINTNNFVLHGIKEPGNSSYPYTIHCTNDYFFLEYDDSYSGYENYGFAMVPKGKEITYYENGREITQTLNYSSCYKFKQKADGNFYFSTFIGPLETNGEKYIEVDTLPTVGNNNYLYIIEENGEKVVYQWRENDSSFFKLSSWFNSIGDYYIDDYIETFYLSSTPLSSIGAYYFEKDLNNENKYYSKDPTITKSLAYSLFGWGFQKDDNWIDFTENAKISVNKDENNNILSYDIGLNFWGTKNNVYGLYDIYYTIDSFGQGNHEETESFLSNILGGAQ